MKEMCPTGGSPISFIFGTNVVPIGTNYHAKNFSATQSGSRDIPISVSGGRAANYCAIITVLLITQEDFIRLS